MGLIDDIENQNLTSSPEREEAKSVKPSKPRTFMSFMGVILLLALTIGGSLYIVKRKPEILGLSRSADNQKEIDKYVSEVGKLILLPDESPTLATVTDLSKVKDQPFFKNAKEGDKVLIFMGSKKAILYRPSEKRIIEVGLVNTTSQTTEDNGKINVELLPSLTPTVAVTPSPTITLTPTKAPTPSLTTPTPPATTPSVNP